MTEKESALSVLSNDIADLVERISPHVVAVQARRSFYSSGVVWREGIIVSAAHTIRREEDISITFGAAEQAKAKLVGKDAGTDLAVLAVDRSDIRPVTSAGSENPRLGDIALIVGRSPNSGPNASFGIVSAVSGPWRTWRGGQMDQYIRLDAALFAGSSGGAVVDQTGRVLGIATNVLSRVAGLAVPAATIDRVVALLLKKGGVPTAYLGVGLHPVPIPESMQQKLSVKEPRGLMILAVESGSPAEHAAMLIGDIILALDGVGIGDLENVQSLLGPDRIGSPVHLKIVRGGELKEITIVPAERRSVQ